MTLQISKKNKLISQFISNSSFNYFDFKFIGSALKLDLSNTHNELISLFQSAKLCVRGNEKIDVNKLIDNLPQINKLAEDEYIEECVITEFRSAIQNIMTIADPNILDRIAAGKVTFDEIPYVLVPGTEVVTGSGSTQIGGLIKNIKIRTNFFGSYMEIKLSVIISTRNGPREAIITRYAEPFVGLMEANKFVVRKITETEKEKLTERGKIFDENIKTVKMASYKGNIGIPNWFGESSLRANGRVMIDTMTLSQMESDRYHQILRPFQVEDHNDYDDFDDDDDTLSDVNLLNNIEDKNLWRCYPKIPGFSMRLKMWGWLEVANLSPVMWRDDAFDNLVLPNKERIFHLVKHYGNGFTDFIEDKSGGLIFLLEGPSGTGKTLTAEAVAETLRRPLYSVSVGELGTTPQEMEEKLRNILDLATQWNAVLLLDEADIFMEARDSNNIERNAMVSIFLRVLEYHSGVLFLTTNRVKAFDPAFFSRISLPIEYSAITDENREIIWANLLNAAKCDVSKFDLKKLAMHKINGRNMKTSLRLAQTNAFGHGREMVQSDIDDVLDAASKFNKKVGI